MAFHIHVRDFYSDDSTTVYPILIVGAGESGILMGCKLKQKLGLDQFRIFDRQSGIGGVWHVNRYPGVACDVPAPFYSYSFSPNLRTKNLYPTGEEVVQYLHDVATSFDLIDKVQFNTDVTEARWVEEDREWEVTLAHLAPGMGDLSIRERADKMATGGESTVILSKTKVRAKVLISSVGFLTEPNPWPKTVPGMSKFAGPIFHTARWNKDIDYHNKSVVVVGTGSSAAQVVPSLLKEPYNVKSVTQLIRTAPWVVPRVNEPLGRGFYERYATSFYGRVPMLGTIFRLIMYARSELDWITIFQSKNRKQREKSEIRSLQRMQRIVPKEYHSFMTPNYPIGCKRRLTDNGWLECMNRSNYTMTSRKLLRVEPHAVVLGPEKTGQKGDFSKSLAEVEIPADIIVLSNGFEGTRWLHPMAVYGRNGTAMNEVWNKRGGPQAYMGTALDGFPNFFMVTGPNASSGHSSYIINSENLAELAIKVALPVLKGDAETIEVKEEAARAWTRQLRKDFKKTTLLGCSSWYQDSSGWNSVIYPRSQTEQTLRCMFPKYNDWKLVYTPAVALKMEARRMLRNNFLVALFVTVAVLLVLRSLSEQWLETILMKVKSLATVE